jgi:hypothetical protein
MDKLVLLGQYSCEDVRFQNAVLINGIGELTFQKLNISNGLTETFVLDAVAAAELHEALTAFYRGEFEAEMTG